MLSTANRKQRNRQPCAARTAGWITRTDLRWLVRRKVDKIPRNVDERDRAKFAKAASYMVLLDDKTACKNPRCRKNFELSGIKTTAFLTD